VHSRLSGSTARRARQKPFFCTTIGGVTNRHPRRSRNPDYAWVLAIEVDALMEHLFGF
jgi:hypothetical protein